MKHNKNLLVLIFIMLFGLIGCSMENIPPMISKASNALTGKEPVVVDSYVTPNTLSNTILPVYIEAQDPDGNMAGLWFVVTQLGVHTQTHYISLKPQDRAAFKGFATIDIPQLHSTERLRIEITVVDQSGLRSSPVVKEVLIGFAFPEKPPSKWKSPEVHNLGHLFFDFLRSREMDRL